MVPMRRLYFLLVLVFLLSQANGADHKKGKGLKPEAGGQDCEWYRAGEDVQGVWENVWMRDCKLDSMNRTIKEPSKSHYRGYKGLTFDTCCTEYMGLECQPSYEGHGVGYCGWPEPDQKYADMGRHKFLLSIKEKKIQDGQQVEEDRWETI